MAEPISVLLVTKGLDIGGIERIVVDLAIGFARRGVLVEVAVVNDARDALAPQLEAAGVPIHRLGGTDRIGVRGARALSHLMRSGRFSVVHVHGPLPSILARLVPTKAHLVTTSHTPLKSLHPLTRVAWTLTARRDHVLTAVSEAVAGSLPRSTRATVRVVPHGVDTARVENALALPTPVRGHHDVVAIAVASHRDAKNYPNLLQAVKVARDLGAPLRLVAVGDGPGIERHRALAADLGLDGAVEFVTPHVNVMATMAAADLLVVASDYEGQPLVVVEALALGLPVVATAVGSIPQLVSADQGLVVPTRDPDRLGRAIASMTKLRDHLVRPGAPKRTLDDVLDDLMGIYR
jgi:glycosyltransferase involved in cell wall biosynthesis